MSDGDGDPSENASDLSENTSDLDDAILDEDAARNSDDEDAAAAALALSIDARAGAHFIPFCKCRAPRVRNNRDFSGRVCVLCGVTSMQPNIRATFDDVKRERAERTSAQPARRPPFSVPHVLQFLLGPDIRAMVYARHRATTRRNVAEARRVFSTVGVEYMSEHQDISKLQLEHLVRGVYPHLRGLNTADGIDVAVDMVISLPAGRWRDVDCLPWMCAALYPETARQDLIDRVVSFLHRARDAPRDDPGDRLRHRSRMFTHRAEPDAAHDAVIEQIVKHEEARHENEIAQAPVECDAGADTWPRDREPSSASWERLSGLCGIKSAAPVGGGEGCGSTSMSKRRRA